MKYLKTCESWETDLTKKREDVIEYLYDIFQELKDKGFTVKISKSDKHYIHIKIYKEVIKSYCSGGCYDELDLFYYNTIKDYIDSAKDYIEIIFGEERWSILPVVMAYTDSSYAAKALRSIEDERGDDYDMLKFIKGFHSRDTINLKEPINCDIRFLYLVVK